MKLFFSFLFLALTSQVVSAQFQYLSPMPGSSLVNPEHNIIIREGHYVDPAFLTPDLFNLHGSKSGDHDFKMVLSADGKTIVLEPSSPFGYNEEVTVTIKKGLRTSERKMAEQYSFNFFTHREYTSEEQQRMKADLQLALQEEFSPVSGTGNETGDAGTRSAVNGGFEITVNTAPSPGVIFFDSFNVFGTGSPYDGFHIITSSGDSVYSNPGLKTLVGDWDLNPNGYLSYENPDSGRFELLDSNYNVVDHYTPANGYVTNGHEFTKYVNNHVFLIADETQIMNLTVYNPSYSSAATVIWGVIQEFDENKNLIFEWRSFDHVTITETNQSLNSNHIDATHTNSIEVDSDGNIIVSHRDLSQVMKINHSTGAFMWRLGGQMNEFTFPNDAEQFNYQHDARVLSNGHLTLWDNGNSHVIHHSTAKEYQLNLVNHVATLSWSYSPIDPATGNAAFYSAMGSVQRLANGNTFINGGLDFSATQPNVLEVTPSGQVVWEMLLNSDSHLVCYRAHHRDWNPCAPVNPQSTQVKKITANSAKIDWDAVSNAVSYDLQYRKLGLTTWKTKTTTSTSKKISNLIAQKSYEYQLRVHCTNGYISDWSALDTFKTAAQKLVSVEQKPSVTLLQIYPNPVSDVLTLDWNTDEDADATIEIYDVAGKLMITLPRINAADETAQLNVSSLPSGFYFARINLESAQQVMQFIKE